MDASCKIQRSIHDVRLTYKYVSRILGTYQNGAASFLIFNPESPELHPPVSGRQNHLLFSFQILLLPHPREMYLQSGQLRLLQ